MDNKEVIVNFALPFITVFPAFTITSLLSIQNYLLLSMWYFDLSRYSITILINIIRSNLTIIQHPYNIYILPCCGFYLCYIIQISSVFVLEIGDSICRDISFNNRQ